MKAKHIVLLLFFVVVLPKTAKGQGTTDCSSAFVEFEQKAVRGNYDELYSRLADIIKDCPKFNEKVYVYGERILKYKIEYSNQPDAKSKYIEELITLYSQYDKSFPANTHGNEMRKAMLLKKHGMASDDEVFEMLDAAFAKNKRSFNDYEALQEYFTLFLKRYETGDKNITEKDFIEKYGEISGQVLYAKNEIEAKRAAIELKKETQPVTEDEKYYLTETIMLPDAFDAVKDNINILASKHFSCQKLEVYYSDKIKTHEEDSGWLEAMVNVMYNNRCYNSPVLYKGAKALYELKPTLQSALFLGEIEVKRRNVKDAIVYFDKAAAMERDSVKKSDIYFREASIFRNIDKAQAKKYILKSAEMNPGSGEPYLMLAEMYISSSKECGLTDFERKALVWLYIDTVKKAELAEPKYEPTVAAMIKNYGKKAPTKQEVKQAGMRKGDELTYGCWINETVTIPNL